MNLTGGIMKSIFIGILFFTGLAKASYYQTDCSNADQSIKTGEGHRYDGVAVTVSQDNGRRSIVEFENEEIILTTLSTIDLRKEESTTCTTGSRSGSISREIWTYKQVKLSRKDNAEFSENTLGVSVDRKSIITDFICHHALSSRTWCP
jgi:hypothetical protein